MEKTTYHNVNIKFTRKLFAIYSTQFVINMSLPFVDQSNVVVMLGKHLGIHPKTTQPLQLLEERFGFYRNARKKKMYIQVLPASSDTHVYKPLSAV